MWLRLGQNHNRRNIGVVNLVPSVSLSKDNISARNKHMFWYVFSFWLPHSSPLFLASDLVSELFILQHCISINSKFSFFYSCLNGSP